MTMEPTSPSKPKAEPSVSVEAESNVTVEAVPSANVETDSVVNVKADPSVSMKADPSVSVETEDATASTAQPLIKKRKVDRRNKLRKTALCRLFNSPGGCPFEDCKFAHGRDEVVAGVRETVEAQRALIRAQVISRAEGQYKTNDDPKAAVRRGTMIERYYTEMFSCDTMKKPQEDHYVHMHSNRLCVVGVAESHKLMSETIEQIEFSPNILDSKVTGKKKKGGQFLTAETILCNVKCKSGASYAIRSCMRGSLLEINERLLENPKLLQDLPLSDGYIAIVQPKKTEIAEIQASLLSKDEYKVFRSITQEQIAAPETPDVEMASIPEAETTTPVVDQ